MDTSESGIEQHSHIVPCRDLIQLWLSRGLLMSEQFLSLLLVIASFPLYIPLYHLATLKGFQLSQTEEI